MDDSWYTYYTNYRCIYMYIPGTRYQVVCNFVFNPLLGHGLFSYIFNTGKETVKMRGETRRVVINSPPLLHRQKRTVTVRRATGDKKTACLSLLFELIGNASRVAFQYYTYIGVDRFERRHCLLKNEYLVWKLFLKVDHVSFNAKPLSTTNPLLTLTFTYSGTHRHIYFVCIKKAPQSFNPLCTCTRYSVPW